MPKVINTQYLDELCYQNGGRLKVSKKAGIHRSVLDKIIGGQLKRRPHSKTVYKLAKAFDVPIKEFLGRLFTESKCKK